MTANLKTARLLMRPVSNRDLGDLVALKSSPLVFGQMLGGVRSVSRTVEELADDICFWGANGYGIWSVRDTANGGFAGITGLMQRPDGRGIALRFAFWPSARGVGLAREAAGAALTYAHDHIHLKQIIGVAREENFASRIILGAVGMVETGNFIRDGAVLLIYKSVRN